MAEAIVIDAATRAISVPDSEARFGCAGERKIEKKHIHIDGRVVDDTDLGIGFSWKVSCENAGGFPCADLIDSIKADVDSIEFDWVVGAAPMAYKGKLKFSICAIRTDVDGSVLQEWHSHIGEGTVAAGLEATAENVGGVDLMAHLQSLAAQAEANRSTSETARKKAESAQSAAADSAAEALNSKNAAAKSAENAAENAKAAGDAATKVIKEGVAEKLTEIIRNNDIKSVTVVRMEVPCCGGLEHAAVTALKNSGKFIPWNVVTISIDGKILD